MSKSTVVKVLSLSQDCKLLVQISVDTGNQRERRQKDVRDEGSNNSCKGGCDSIDKGVSIKLSMRIFRVT